MVEIFKDIKGYEGIYQISNIGNVKSLQSGKEKILVQQVDQKGYRTIKLYKDGSNKRFKVHRLVAEAFIPNPNHLPQVNHIDENKENNIIENLEWCTNQYNSTYSSGKRVIKCDKDGNILKVYNSRSEAALSENVNLGTITRRCNRKESGWYYEDN